MTNKVLTVGLGAALALVFGAEPGSAARHTEGAEPSPQELRKAELQKVMVQWPQDPSPRELVGRGYVTLDLVATVHPMPSNSYGGTTLQARADAASMALRSLGATVEEIEEEIPDGDRPRRYVADAAKKSLDMLAQAFNKHLIPAGKALDQADEFVSNGAGALQVIATINGSDPGCQRANARGALFSPAALVRVLVESATPAQAGCGQANQQTNDELNKQDKTQFDPVVAQTGRGIEIITKEELPLVAMVHEYVTMAGEKTKEAVGHLAPVFEVLEAAERVKEEMAAKAGDYSQGMKGSADTANASAKAVQQVIDAVGEYAAMIHQVGGRSDALINGPVKTAYDKVYDCTLENIRVAQLLQTGAEDGAKAAAVRVAKAKNVAAVAAVEGVSGPLKEFKSMKGGALQVALLPEGRSAGVSAPRAGLSPTVDGKALKKGKAQAQALACGADGEGC